MFEIDVKPNIVDLYIKNRAGFWKPLYTLAAERPFTPNVIFEQIISNSKGKPCKAVSSRGNQLACTSSIPLLLYITGSNLITVHFSDCDGMSYFSANNPKFLPITTLQSQFLERKGIRKARIRHHVTSGVCPTLFDVKFNDNSTATIALYR